MTEEDENARPFPRNRGTVQHDDTVTSNTQPRYLFNRGTEVESKADRRAATRHRPPAARNSFFRRTVRQFAMEDFVERVADRARDGYWFWANRRWLQIRVALAVAVCGALVGGAAGLILQLLSSLAAICMLGEKHNWRDHGAPYLADPDRIVAVISALISGAVAHFAIGTSGVASLTIIAGAGAAMERRGGVGRETQLLRVAWAAGVALLAYLLPVVARALSAAGTTSDVGRSAFAAAWVAATALSLDSPKSMQLGGYALLAAYAGASCGGHLPPATVNVIAAAVAIAAISIAGGSFDFLVFFIGALSFHFYTLPGELPEFMQFFSLLPQLVRYMLHLLWTGVLIAAAATIFWCLAAKEGRLQPHETLRLLVASAPGVFLAMGWQVPPELTVLGAVAPLLVGLLLEAAFDHVAAEKEAAFQHERAQAQQLRAQLQQLEAQLAHPPEAPAPAPDATDADAADAETDTADDADGAASPIVPPEPGDRLCCICQHAAASHACLPCGHRSSCRACLEVVRASATPDCPVCRRRIRGIVHVFTT